MTNSDRATDRRSEDDLVGGKYRLVRRLGKGGMGEVHEASNENVGGKVAIKFLGDELAQDTEFTERFEREAKMAASIEDKRNVCLVFERGFHHGRGPYLVMEYLTGENLLELVDRHHGRLHVRRAVDIIIQACRGLQAVHSTGIIHRDIKPANLFICHHTKDDSHHTKDDSHHTKDDDVVKIIDFGIAKRRTVATLTKPGNFPMTPRYAAPERRNCQDGDHRSDIYSLGVVLYEMLAGSEAVDRIENDSTIDPLPLDKLRRDLPARLCAVTHKAMARDVCTRFQTAKEMEQALTSCVPKLSPGIRNMTVTRVAAAILIGALAYGVGRYLSQDRQPTAVEAARSPPRREPILAPASPPAPSRATKLGPPALPASPDPSPTTKPASRDPATTPESDGVTSPSPNSEEFPPNPYDEQFPPNPYGK